MKKYVCKRCGEVFTASELRGLKIMGENYYQSENGLICPDCWDRFQSMSLEDREEILLDESYTHDPRDKNDPNKFERYGPDEKSNADYDAGYAEGLNAAWEAARQLRHPRYGAYTDSEKKDIFGYANSDDILTRFTAAEAIEQFKAYEKKKAEDEEFKVGDEVQCNDTNGVKMVVTHIYGEEISGVGKEGTYALRKKRCWHKTGRHFSQIAEALKQLQEVDDGN